MTTTMANSTMTTQAMTDRARRLRSRVRAAVGQATGSARARILASYVILLLFATVVSVVAARQLLLARLDDRVRDTLAQETQEFRRLVGGSDPRTGEPFGSDLRAIFDVFLSRNVPGEGEQIIALLEGEPYRTVAAPGSARLVASEPRLVERWGSLREPETGEVETANGTATYAVVPIKLGGEVRGQFVVANLLAGERAEVDDAIRIIGGVALAILAIGTVIAFLSAGRVLAPLRQLTETARQITESDLTQRIDVHGDDELAHQARTFNAMLDRLEEAFASQRRLVRDVGHELRTPLTIIRGNLEVLDEDDDPEERRETLTLVDDELDRMSRLVEDLVVLARAERPDFLALQTVELASLSRELYTKAQQLGPREWRMEQHGRGVIVADRQRLTQAVMNLAENAVRQTKEGDVIALGSSLEGGVARLWVRDWGPGVAPADEERIFERFARGEDGGRYAGTGLGLAIVKAVAEAHAGRVELHTRPGEGARFTVVIPVEHPPFGTR